MDAIFDILAEMFSFDILRSAVARMRRDVADWCDIRMTSPLAGLAGLNCIAGLILMRSRGTGSTFKLSDTRLCVAAAAAAGLTIAVRWALSNCQRREPAFWIKAALAAFSVLPLAVLFAVATPRNSLLAVSVVGALAVVAGNANLVWTRRSNPFASEPDQTREFRHEVSTVGRAAIASPIRLSDRPSRSLPAESPIHPAAAEWCERSTDERGNTVLRGSIVVRFDAGQSLATAHIPFQPPFERAPELSCEVVDAPAIRLRTPAVFRYGARLELKRSGEDAGPLQLLVRFHTVARDRAARAA